VARYLLTRASLSVASLFGALLFTFVITHLLPGNPILVHAGLRSAASIKLLEQQMGLDQPIPLQFEQYLQALGRGDLGHSWSSGNSVAMDLRERLPASVELGTFATILAVLVGVPLGVLSAVRRGGVWDRVARVLGVSGVSMPVFWLGLLLILAFYYGLHIAPAPIGRISTQTEAPPVITGLLTLDSLIAGNLPAAFDALSHLVLPGVTLAMVVMVPIMRITRSSMLEALGESYVRTARAAGIPARQIIFGDALRNSLVNVLTISGLAFGYLIGGAVLVEKVFAWPGLGQYALNALLENDYSAIQGFILAITTIYILLNLGVDVLYGLIDPRIGVAAEQA
jgi:peptide/nickel transport system permease protein